MPVTVRIPPLDVIYKELYVMQPLYRAMRLWLRENDYVDLQKDESMESMMEILYLERRGTAQNPREKELRIWWRTINKGQYNSAYYTHHLDIDINVINQVDMEIMHQGKKLKVQHGEMRISIRPYILMPDMNRHPILQFVDNYFRTRILKRNLEEQKKMLYQDAYRFQGMIKRYLELKSFLPTQEDFHKKFEFI